MLRWKLSHRAWRKLKASERDELLSYELYITRNLDELADSLMEQKAYSAEVAVLSAAAGLGL